MRYFTLIVSILIIIAVLLPGSTIPDVSIVGFDKFVHVGMFATWTVALRYDFPATRPSMVFLLATGFSVLTEVLQLFVEGRSFDLYDMLADAFGIIIGLLLANPINKWITRLFKRS